METTVEKKEVEKKELDRKAINAFKILLMFPLLPEPPNEGDFIKRTLAIQGVAGYLADKAGFLEELSQATKEVTADAIRNMPEEVKQQLPQEIVEKLPENLRAELAATTDKSKMN